jgi:hypothetical protein
MTFYFRVCLCLCVCVRVSSSRCVSDRISSWTSDVAKYGHRGESLHLAKTIGFKGWGVGPGGRGVGLTEGIDRQQEVGVRVGGGRYLWN